MINKSAKTSRDTKRSSFCSQKYDVVNRSKVRESKLYELKDKVLQKLLAENKANIKGIHKQKIKKEGYRYNEKGELEWQEWTDEVSLTLIGFNGFTYHRPATREEVQKYAVLGDIDIISAEKRSDIKIKFKEAVNCKRQIVPT